MPADKYDSVLDLIGNTPLLRITGLEEKNAATIYVKMESGNPGGSIKDRICLAMIDAAEKDGLLKPGATVIEPTSGNTGIGLSMVCAVRGYKLILTMPDTMSIERRRLLAAYGAELILTPGSQGMRGAVQKAEELAAKHGYYMPQQFKNPANPDDRTRNHRSHERPVHRWFCCRGRNRRNPDRCRRSPEKAQSGHQDRRGGTGRLPHSLRR